MPTVYSIDKNLAHNFGFAFTIPSCRCMLPYDPQVTSRGFNTCILCAIINNPPMFTLTRQIGMIVHYSICKHTTDVRTDPLQRQCLNFTNSILSLRPRKCQLRYQCTSGGSKGAVPQSVQNVLNFLQLFEKWYIGI